MFQIIRSPFYPNIVTVRAHIWDLKLPGWNDRLEIHPDDYARLPKGYEFVPFSGRDQAVMCWEPEGKEFKEIEIQIMGARNE